MHCRSRKEQRAAAAADLELSVGVEGGGRRGICGQRGRIRSCGGAGNRWGKAAAGEGAPDRGEGAFDRGGEGRPEGIELSIGAAQATGGEGRRRCGRRRSLAKGRSDGVLAEGRSNGGRRRPVRFQVGGWGRGSLVISLVFTWSENPSNDNYFGTKGVYLSEHEPQYK